MNCIEQIGSSFFSFLTNQYNLDRLQLNRCSFDINSDTEKAAFGDINSNAAMMLAQSLKSNPRLIAQTIVENFTHPFIAKIEIAGPGFLNFFLTDAAFLEIAHNIFEQQNQFFKPSIPSKKINVEFVSANPTGPLHFGHGRNGILGDTLATILTFLGHDVTREFYINDAGSQITKLGNSLKIRYLQALGNAVAMPDDAYHGQYLIDFGTELASLHGATLTDNDHLYFEDIAKKKMLAQQQETLQSYGIKFDVWFSEKALKSSINIDDYIKKLSDNGYTYELDGALWFATTQFGDDKDRVLRKSDGEYTYLAGDLPYLVDKLERGFDSLIMILGQDHHSFVVRLHALMQALGYDPKKLTVILYQLVHITKNGESARMSKRAGTIVDLHDIINTVGKDVARFFYLNRKADAELEFDIELALTTTSENPVYYVQYAYVRTCSILEKAALLNPDLINLSVADCQHLSTQEKNLIKKIAALKNLLLTIDSSYQTHLLAYYTYELANLFHTYYNSSKALVDDQVQTKNNLFIIKIMQQTFHLCFELMGISSPSKM
ncbi:arginine--tRNA ligase [Candidatus Babeliales bacterium]|nr:arginine--tRNA ligase [Candidatus Babeliales bacterium]MBP9843834.1 arginine--tRNA ligase [Candidatus Babeliales bacterium]